MGIILQRLLKGYYLACERVCSSVRDLVESGGRHLHILKLVAGRFFERDLEFEIWISLRGHVLPLLKLKVFFFVYGAQHTSAFPRLLIFTTALLVEGSFQQVRPQ